MAIVKEDRCVGCHAELGCLGSTCSNKNYTAYYCDKCNEEFDELYEYEDMQLCKDCVLQELPKVVAD